MHDGTGLVEGTKTLSVYANNNVFATSWTRTTRVASNKNLIVLEFDVPILETPINANARNRVSLNSLVSTSLEKSVNINRSSNKYEKETLYDSNNVNRFALRDYTSAVPVSLTPAP